MSRGVGEADHVGLDGDFGTPVPTKGPVQACNGSLNMIPPLYP